MYQDFLSDSVCLQLKTYVDILSRIWEESCTAWYKKKIVEQEEV